MNKVRSWAAISGLALAAVACDDATGPGGSSQASLSFTNQSQVVGARPQFSVMDTLIIGGHRLALTSVDLTVSQIEIEGDSTHVKMKSAGTTFSVPMNGGVVTPVTVTLPGGTYDEIQFKIESVRVQGTYDGEPFDASLRVVTKIDMHVDPPLVVGDSGQANLTIALNTAHWFITNQGNLLDPRNLSESQKAQIMSNIKSTFRAFDDDNRNGRHDQGDDDDHDDDDDDDEDDD